MSSTLRTWVKLLVVLAPALAGSQVRLELSLPLPQIRFEVAPPLVVVSPGVQVVEDFDDEVFFADGWYWVRTDDRWYRSRDHAGHWVVVERRRVPATIVSLPPGQYRKYRRSHGDGFAPPGQMKHKNGDSSGGDKGGKHHGGRGKGKH